MPIDASIYGQFAPKVQSPADVQNGLMQGAMAQNQLAQGRMQMQQAQNVMQQRSGLAQAMQSGQFDLTNPAHQAQMAAQFPDVAPGLLKTVNEGVQSAAKARLDTAQAGEADAKTTKSRVDLYHQQLGGINDYQSAVDYINRGAKDPIIGPTMNAQAELKKIPTPDQDPDGSKLAKWKADMEQSAVDAKERLDLQQKKQEEQGRNTRAVAENATKVQVGEGNNKAMVQSAGIHAGATLGAAKIGQQTQFAINGIDPKTGQMVPFTPTDPNAPPGAAAANPMGALVDAIGKNQIPLSVALQRVPPGLKAQVMAGVQAKYPDYDETALAARAKANRDFTTGPLGNSLRSFAVAGQHLDQLGQLADALDNGNLKIVNKIAQAYSEQTGNPAPTNFDATKDVVSKEVIKAIVAGGGGVSERQELKDSMDKAKSPAQLKGVIAQYRNLMSAQHDALLQQRRAAGLPDSSLPNYAPPAAPSASLPQGWKIEKVTK